MNEKNWQAFPGLVCKSGLIIGYWNDKAEQRWFASKRKAIKWLTPLIRNDGVKN